jgi:hypothetical protein
MESKDIIERVIGYSDKEMHEYCLLLDSVINATIIKDVKVGNKKEKMEVFKYDTDKDTKNRISNSIKHYAKLMGEKGLSFRDYQLDIIDRGSECINKHGFVYLAMEVRTGKTLTSLGICRKIGSKSVLFVTKKKAISSIENDYALLSPSYSIDVINYESLHTIAGTKNWDAIIVDEAHSLGALPKPSARAIAVADIIKKNNPKIILLSGTPTPESYGQMYHQVYGIPGNPFKEYKTFYKFAADYVDVKQKKVNSMFINDYSHGKESILNEMKPYTISYTQQEAGFESKIKEEILYCSLKPSTYNMIKRLKNDLVIQGKEEVILADTSVKLMTKLHQMYSGTVKFESGKSMVIDTTKAEFIKENFEGCKIGIFYKFKEEYEALKQVFGDELTTELDEFNNSWKNIALQIVSGREGISLRLAEYLVYYNIDFSATSYWQSRDRMTTKERKENTIYWVFSKDGIEDKIYKAVSDKKDYTVNHFKKDLLSL